MAARGSLDLLGPLTKRAVAAVLAGTAAEDAGAFGDTNGAAIASLRSALWPACRIRRTWPI